jgi:hypothetical protein
VIMLWSSRLSFWPESLCLLLLLPCIQRVLLNRIRWRTKCLVATLVCGSKSKFRINTIFKSYSGMGFSRLTASFNKTIISLNCSKPCNVHFYIFCKTNQHSHH